MLKECSHRLCHNLAKIGSKGGLCTTCIEQCRRREISRLIDAEVDKANFLRQLDQQAQRAIIKLGKLQEQCSQAMIEVATAVEKSDKRETIAGAIDAYNMKCAERDSAMLEMLEITNKQRLVAFRGESGKRAREM